MICGLTIGFSLGLIVFFGSTVLLNNYLESQGYYYKAELNRAKEFQDFIHESHLTTADTSQIQAWAKTRGIHQLVLFKNQTVLINESYDKDSSFISMPFLNMNDYYYYTITFADGKADLFIYEGAGSQYFLLLLFFSCVLSFFLCLLILSVETHKDIQDIKHLISAIHIIEDGCFNKTITINRYDELGQLADGLNEMRRRLLEKEDTESALRNAQKKMILGMSHDLRTPLTGLITCLEILRQQLKGEPLFEYIENAYSKTLQIRALSDQIFEFFLIDSQASCSLELPESILSAIGDYLSEFIFLIKSYDFDVDSSNIVWHSDKIRINSDYLGRIMNNILSNILKYAAPGSIIYIRTIYSNDYVGISFENNKIPVKDSNGTGIGLKNISMMMNRMNGHLETKQNDRTFIVTLFFPTIS